MWLGEGGTADFGLGWVTFDVSSIVLLLTSSDGSAGLLIAPTGVVALRLDGVVERRSLLATPFGPAPPPPDDLTAFLCSVVL